jgi:xanthine phosphoribosyltransferase
MTMDLNVPDKIHAITWHETHRDATDLADRLAPLGPWRGLVIISRGGLVPGAIVARALGIVCIETVCMTSYKDRVRGPVEIVKHPPPSLGEGSGWLMIDDLADTGATADEARRMLPSAHFATLYAKPAGRPFVDTFVREVPQDVWIDFPWDRNPAPSP